MHRLRQATFDMTSGPGDTLATLRDITTIGIAVHAHTAAFHGAQPATAPEPTLDARGAEALVLRGRAWQALHRELSHFVTLAPPGATVRDDLIALARLLPALAPLDVRASSAKLADPASRRIGASLNGALATMTDIGDQSAAAFADFARTGALRLNARDLPRDLVAADPDLAHAKLRSARRPAHRPHRRGHGSVGRGPRPSHPGLRFDRDHRAGAQPPRARDGRLGSHLG